MMDFRKGFFLVPRKKEPGMQQKYEETKKKQTKSSLHQEISEFSPSGQMRMDQLIKIVLNLQEKIKKLLQENTKLTELINNGLQDTLDLRMANYEKEIDIL